MGYQHINNLYKNQTILLFKECYAMEKIHGTSAHISITPEKISYFSGGEKHDKFVALFDEQDLRKRYSTLDPSASYILFGEAYGGKQQGMKYLYGDTLKFIVFDVKVGNHWLAVPNAEAVANAFGQEFVHYVKIPTTIEALNAERDKDSVQCIRNNVDISNLPEGKTLLREGIVLRPLIEVTLNGGDRVCAKHKNEKFSERKTKQKIDDPAKLLILEEADEIATEWVTEVRLEHVLDKLPQDINIEHIPDVIAAMIEDVTREAAGEIIDSKEARRAISKLTVQLYKQHLKNKLNQKE